MMKAIETSGLFNEKGQLVLDNPLDIKNQKVKLLILIEEGADDDFYNLAGQRLATAYSEDETAYNVNSIKEANPYYNNASW